MLNIIWPIFVIVAFIYAICFGNIETVNIEIFSSVESAVEMSIKLLGTMCLWNGLIKIAEKTTIIQRLNNFLNPIFKFLFPEINKKSKAYGDVSMNIVANIMGLGNAATPAGLNAMKELQKENKNKKVLSNSMLMFIVINTASLQIIPTTVIAIRSSLNSNNPTKMIFAIWIATLSAAITAVSLTKIMIKRR